MFGFFGGLQGVSLRHRVAQLMIRKVQLEMKRLGGEGEGINQTAFPLKGFN